MKKRYGSRVVKTISSLDRFFCGVPVLLSGFQTSKDSRINMLPEFSPDMIHAFCLLYGVSTMVRGGLSMDFLDSYYLLLDKAKKDDFRTDSHHTKTTVVASLLVWGFEIINTFLYQKNEKKNVTLSNLFYSEHFGQVFNFSTHEVPQESLNSCVMDISKVYDEVAKNGIFGATQTTIHEAAIDTKRQTMSVVRKYLVSRKSVI